MMDRWEHEAANRQLPSALTAGTDAGRVSLTKFQYLTELSERYRVIAEFLETEEPLSSLSDGDSIVGFVESECNLKVADILGSQRSTDDNAIDFSVDEVIQVMKAACKAAGATEGDFRVAFKAFLKSNDQLTQDELKRQRRSLDHALVLASIPDDTSFAKLLRYDALLFNQYLKLLHELQRLQAARKGETLLAPVAMDVNVSVDTPGLRTQRIQCQGFSGYADTSDALPLSSPTEPVNTGAVPVLNQAVATTPVKRSRGRPKRGA